MQNSFYRNFLDENDKVVIVIGGGGKSTLINRIVADCRSLGKTAIITSLFPFKIPVEAHTCISNDVKMLKNQLADEIKKHTTVYLGKNLEKDVISGLNNKEVKELIRDIEADHLFLEADITYGRSLSDFAKIQKNFPFKVNRCINVIGADSFNQKRNPSWIISDDPFWDSRPILTPLTISEWYKTHPVLQSFLKKAIPLTFFINKVENIFVENLAIPLAKAFKMFGAEKVIIGSIYNSTIHVIK